MCGYNLSYLQGSCMRYILHVIQSCRAISVNSFSQSCAFRWRCSWAGLACHDILLPSTCMIKVPCLRSLPQPTNSSAVTRFLGPPGCVEYLATGHYWEVLRAVVTRMTCRRKPKDCYRFTHCSPQRRGHRRFKRGADPHPRATWVGTPLQHSQRRARTGRRCGRFTTLSVSP